MVQTTTNKPTACDDGLAPNLADLEDKVRAAQSTRPRPKRQMFEVTDAAAARIQSLLDQRGKPSAGVKISVRPKGCSGLSYTLEYADTIHAGDEMVEDKGVRILIDPKASLFVIGTIMDFVREEMAEGFVFVNPNEKGRCGCGESFHV